MIDDGFDDIPEPMRSALIEQVELDNEAFALDMAADYRKADKHTQSDILAFFESDGPEKVRQVRLKHEDGILTAADLKEQFDQ